MNWVWGAGLGFLRGGPFGALIGGTAQHFLSKRAKKKTRDCLPGLLNESLFVACVVTVLTNLASQKGQLNPSSVEVMYRFFSNNLGYRDKDLDGINRWIRRAYLSEPDLPGVAREYLRATNNQYRSLIVGLSYQATLVDGALNEEQIKKIDVLVESLHIDMGTHNQIRQQFALDALRTPYSILEIPDQANWDQIKKAYRKRASEFHPDKFQHKGNKEAEMAHVRFLEIQDAYRTLEKKHS